jgi:DNA polymerase-1
MQINNTDRLYTQIHQVGTVSGRVTSDFQQFPKDPIKTVDGIELFHPRKIILVDGGDFDSIVYLDYSQIELRFQALYTILVGHPDMNLCRAYMPYECQTDDGMKFDHTNSTCIQTYKCFDWYLNESPTTKWVKTDVHGATTKLAFEIDETNPEWHSLRYKGKRLNFAKNYGASLPRVRAMFPEYSLERCKVINDAYYLAFPGVKIYHDYCYARAYYPYTENLFGIKYYNVSGHKLINILVQGSAAFYLKLKIIELYKYSKEQNIKTKWQMQIHDELSWQHHKDDDPQIFFEFKRIMEDWPDTLVPVVAEMEMTQTNWAEKKEVKSLADFQVCACA